VLPEDDANNQLATGFQLGVDVPRQMQVLEEAGGWAQVLDRFVLVHVQEMNRHANRFMVLLIDFDGKAQRLIEAQAKIPHHLSDRVFVLGAQNNPEGLRTAGLGTYEEIGFKMAADCRNAANTIWGHHLLQNNAAELGRLLATVRPILFS
jgi:hypothetical protein